MLPAKPPPPFWASHPSILRAGLLCCLWRIEIQGRFKKRSHALGGSHSLSAGDQVPYLTLLVACPSRQL